jgi:hypothetical protein
MVDVIVSRTGERRHGACREPAVGRNLLNINILTGFSRMQ